MPQPIDTQTGLAQITQAQRVQQIVDRVSLAAQQRTAIETQEQQVATETEVQQTHAKADDVDSDLRRHNPYMGRRRRGRDKEETEQSRTKSAPNGEDHVLDVTI